MHKLIAKAPEQFREFLTDIVIKWNAGQKMAFFMVLMSIEVLTYLGWMLYVKHSAYAQQYVNISIINNMFFYTVAAFFACLIIAFIFYRLQKHNFIKKLQLIVMLVYTLCAAYVGYLVGQDNILSAIAVSTAGILVVMFCERIYSYWIVGLNVISMFTVMYASKSGIFPEPNFYIGSTNSVFWVYSYFYLCAAKVMVILLLFDNMLYVLKNSYHNTKFISEHDPLTALPNRRNIQNFLQTSVQHQQPVSTIMIDLDYFKRINDNYGHLMGDKVLKEVAKLLKAEIRSTDKVGRFGGEEFLMILPDTSMVLAITTAQRIHSNLNKLVIHLTDNKSLSPTASFGVVGSDYLLAKNKSLTSKPDAHQYDALIEQMISECDDAMYIAKENGRNQVVSASEIPEAYRQKKMLAMELQ